MKSLFLSGIIFIIINSFSVAQKSSCLEQTSKSIFCPVVDSMLTIDSKLNICDTMRMISKLLRSYRNNESACQFAFIKSTYTLNTLYTPGSNGALLRRKDFGIIVYIHFFLLKDSLFDKNKEFVINTKAGSLIKGEFLFDNEKDEKKQKKTTSKKMNKLYRKMIKWARYSERKKLSIDSAFCDKKYPFNAHYLWIGQ